MGVLRRYMWSLGVIAACLAVASLASLAGLTGRVAPEGAREVQALTSADVMGAVTDSGARGCTLIMFDDHFRLLPQDERYRNLLRGTSFAYAPDDTNLMSAMISSGAIRRVIAIAPDSRHAQLSEAFDSAWDVSKNGGGWRFRFGGAPVDIVLASAAPEPSSSQHVVVLLNTSIESSYPRELIDRWTDQESAGLLIEYEVPQ